MTKNFTTSSEHFSVRRFSPQDRAEVLALWPADVMHSHPGSETIDVLISTIEGAIAGKDSLWVAEASGRIIGSAAIIPNNYAPLAHLKCLCVDSHFPDWHAVARGLAEIAIRDVYEHGYLKLAVHTNLPHSQLDAALHDLGFEFSREHSLGGETVLEFYQNLYERPRRMASQEGQSS